jgi:hypothetical protein
MREARMKRTFACVLVVSALAGCGPVQSTAFLIDSQVQLEAARTAGAPKYAPYPWTAANLYLHEARVEVGYSNYDVALGYAQKASKFAREAKQQSIARANAEAGPDVNNDGADQGGAPDSTQDSSGSTP